MGSSPCRLGTLAQEVVFLYIIVDDKEKKIERNVRWIISE